MTMTKRTVAMVGALLMAAALGRTARAEERSLYERLGGVGPISVVIDEFIDRLAADKVLNANPAIKAARGRVPTSYLKFHVTTLVCQVTGGPCKYTGRSMKDSHTHLKITEREWAEMAKVFRAVLDKHKVPAREQEELFSIVGGTKGDIVTAGPPVDRARIAGHLTDHVSYPATRAELVAGCNGLADFTGDEKRWFAEKLPEGKYGSALEVKKALGMP